MQAENWNAICDVFLSQTPTKAMEAERPCGGELSYRGKSILDQPAPVDLLHTSEPQLGWAEPGPDEQNCPGDQMTHEK